MKRFQGGVVLTPLVQSAVRSGWGGVTMKWTHGKGGDKGNT